jgi:hypothetical protein
MGVFSLTLLRNISARYAPALPKVFLFQIQFSRINDGIILWF